MKYIRDRGMKATKIFATLMALGVVASGIFGMTQAGKDLVNKTLYTVSLYTVCSMTAKHCLPLALALGLLLSGVLGPCHRLECESANTH